MTTRSSRRPEESRRAAYLCEALEGRTLLAVSLVLNGPQTAVPGATIDVSAFVNTPPSPDTATDQSEMSLVINPTNPLNLVGFSHRLAAPIVMDLYRSTDGGTTWTTTQIDNADDGLGAVGNRYDPAVAFDANGTLYIAYGHRGSAVAPLRPSRVVAAASTDGGQTFVNFRVIDTQADILTPSTTDTDLPGVDRWTLATGRDPATGNQAAYVTFTENVAEGAAGTDQRVVIAGTRDGGANWTAPTIINDGSINGTNAGGLGAAPAVSFGGEVFVTWWDAGTSVIADRDRDGLWANNFNFGTDLTVRTNAGIGNVNGAPAQPERGIRFSPSLAINTFNRDLYVTFHERFGATGVDTDIMFGRSSDFGDTWTWVRAEGSTGTDFNPWIAFDPDSGAIGIAYYSTEGDQATGNDDVRPRMALSADNGNNWTRAFLSTQTSNEGPNVPNDGDYDGDYLEYNGFAFLDGTAHHLWASRYPGGGTDLDAFTTRVSLDSATNGNVLRIAGIGGAPDDSTVIRRAPANNNFVEVIENGARTYLGLLASIDSITIETGGGVHSFSIENLPPIPVNVLGSPLVDVVTIDSLSGVSGLTFSGGAGADRITLGSGPFDADTITSPVSVFGDAGNDTLVIGSGNADAVAVNVTFNGGPDQNSVVYNDTSPTYRAIYDVGTSSITRTGLSLPRVLSYANVASQITLNCGAAGDTVTVRNGVPAGIFAFGNGGNDNFVRGDGNVTATSGAVFNGGAGTDRIIFDDHLRPGNLIWDFRDNEVIYGGLILFETTGFEAVGVLAGNGNDEITFTGSLSQSFDVDAGGGNDDVYVGFMGTAQFNAPVAVSGGAGDDDFIWRNGSRNWADLFVGQVVWPVALDGGGGFNQLSLDETARTHATLEFAAGRIFTREPAPFAFGADFAYDNMGAVGVTLSNGNNGVVVTGVSADIDAGNQVTIFMGGGADAAVVRPHGAAGELTINGNLGIIGGDAADTLTIDDTASALPIDYSFSNPFGSGTQNVFGLGTRGGLGTATLETIRINAGNGPDTFAVNQFTSGVGLGINAGGGDDVLQFGNNGLAAVTNLAFFDFNGGPDSDTFNLNNQTHAGTWTYTRNAGSIAASSTLGASYFLTDSNTELMRLNGGPSGETFNVNAVMAGSAVEVNAAGGVDLARLTPAAGSGESIQGPVSFHAGADGGSVVVFDNLDTTGDTFHLTQDALGASPGDNLFGAGGSLHFSGLTDVNLILTAIVVHLGSGSDVAYAQPLASGTAVINLNAQDAPVAAAAAGLTPAAGGDALILALAGAANYIVTETSPSAGNMTSDTTGRLSWTGLDVPLVIDDAAPPVTGVWVGGSAWTTAFKNYLQSTGAGDAALGYAVAAGGDQPEVMPWTNLDRVSVRFGEDVGAGQASLAALGVGVVGYGIAGFAYDPATFTATWTLAAPIGADRVRLSLNGVADLAGNPLADFGLPFDVLPGDATRDGRVSALDLLDVRTRMLKGATTGNGGLRGYSPFADFNGDGWVLAVDYAAVRFRLASVLPPEAVLVTAAGDARRLAEQVLA